MNLEWSVCDNPCCHVLLLEDLLLFILKKCMHWVVSAWLSFFLCRFLCFSELSRESPLMTSVWFIACSVINLFFAIFVERYLGWQKILLYNYFPTLPTNSFLLILIIQTFMKIICKVTKKNNHHNKKKYWHYIRLFLIIQWRMDLRIPMIL